VASGTPNWEYLTGGHGDRIGGLCQARGLHETLDSGESTHATSPSRENALGRSSLSLAEIVNDFEVYVEPPRLGRLMVRYEIYKRILNVKGCILECGVRRGGGLMAWAKMSALFEPFGVHRKVIGFDTFEGFPSVSEKDELRGEHRNDQLRPGGFGVEPGSYEHLQQRIQDFQQRWVLLQNQKVELVRGDACLTLPEYVKANPHLLVSLLFMDFDLYEPTKVALDTLLPRMPKGAVLAFDEINNPAWPGETCALLDCLNLRDHRIEKFPFEPNISFIVL